MAMYSVVSDVLLLQCLYGNIGHSYFPVSSCLPVPFGRERGQLCEKEEEEKEREGAVV